MLVTRIQANNFTNLNPQISVAKKQSNEINKSQNTTASAYHKIPAGHRYGANIHFGEFFDPNRTVPHIDYEEYMAMKEPAKKRFRKRYENFFKDPIINTEEMFDQNYRYMPLRTEREMDNFIKTASIYKKYKEQPIISLGRSPKWFLNAALWMKDGIDDYKFVAFSTYWNKPDPIEGMIRIPENAPTEKEELAYRKYLKRIKADPQTIVDNMQKTGKKTVITDYLFSGKGACSFLEIMGNYAKDLGILEEFSKSIQIVGIGSMEYVEERTRQEYISEPKAFIPNVLRPFEKNIKQEFYDMDYYMFKNMLINQNTNECRSTYYPPRTWTIYKPDQFKTGLVKDIKKVKEMIKQLKANHERTMSSFTPAMFDFRNLLNFRILDGLNERGILKAIHKSKI